MPKRRSPPRSRSLQERGRKSHSPAHGRCGGDQSAAIAALKTLIDEDAGDASYQVAEVYALRNDAKETFAWLDRAWTNRDPGIQALLYDPLILRFKDDPRFAAFCRKVGLPVPGAAATSKSS